MHKIADEVHTWDAANYILRRCASAEDERAVFEVAGWIVRLNIMRFDAIYEAYA
jgi:hypothetical protein